MCQQGQNGLAVKTVHTKPVICEQVGQHAPLELVGAGVTKLLLLLLVRLVCAFRLAGATGLRDPDCRFGVVLSLPRVLL